MRHKSDINNTQASQMLISIYRDVRDSRNPFVKSVGYCLDRIKNGASKEVICRFRDTFDDALKSSLPGYCWSGQFKQRKISGLIQHSGLIVLDFDKYKDEKEAIEMKNSICDDDFVYSAFISPSGKGVKVLVKIPAEPENHVKYFNALVKHFQDDHLDISGKDVSRFCFESYDPDLYLNENSKVWTKMEVEDVSEIGESADKVKVKITSDHEIINRLQTWFDKKYSVIEGQRNNNVFIFASALHDFGINKNTAISHLFQYAGGSFNEKEIERIVNSAYSRNPEKFGSRAFEDIDTINAIKKDVISGLSDSEIKKKYKDNGDVAGVVKVARDEEENFWYYDDKGRIKLSPIKFKTALENSYGFSKYFPSVTDTYIFIRKVEGGFIEETNEDVIKDIILKSLCDEIPNIGNQPFDFMARNTSYFTPNFLSMINSEDIKIKEDTKDTAYLYFSNKVVKVVKDKVELIDYIDLKDELIWKRQVIDREFERVKSDKSEFQKFIWLVAGQNEERYNSFKSVIGYLLHTYKTSSRNKAIIFNDETISDEPNGGSGKGIFWNALSKMKRVSSIDGKTFDFSKSFPYQTVSKDTQILVFDDVKKNFNFESLFSVITEGITLEYKNMGAIKIPVSKSPKILITTNYTIGGTGGSHDRRKFEVEMSAYFGVHHTPEDEFGHMLFDDWDKNEWLLFDNFMVDCLQFYLANGLVAHEFHNLHTRKFIKETNHEFYEWSKPENTNIKFNVRESKTELYNNFISDYPDYAQGKYKLSQKRFKSYLDKFGEFYGYEVEEGRDQTMRWIKFINENGPIKQEEDDDDCPF